MWVKLVIVLRLLITNVIKSCVLLGALKVKGASWNQDIICLGYLLQDPWFYLLDSWYCYSYRCVAILVVDLGSMTCFCAYSCMLKFKSSSVYQYNAWGVAMNLPLTRLSCHGFIIIIIT